MRTKFKSPEFPHHVTHTVDSNFEIISAQNAVLGDFVLQKQRSRNHKICESIAYTMAFKWRVFIAADRNLKILQLRKNS